MADHEAEPDTSCDVCGRTILSGERVTAFLAPDGERRTVCALCHERADAGGWVRADSAGSHVRTGTPRRRRGLRVRERARPYVERARSYAERARPPQRAERPGGERGTSAPAADASAPSEAEPPGEPKPGEQPAESASEKPKPKPKPRKRPPDTPERRIDRAIARFNDSDQRRVVSGLIRSLGEPQAAVEDISARPPRVQVTVAWELSWYRWEVGLDGDQDPVREVAKGAELSELDAEPEWNASVDGEGRVRWDDGSS